MDPHAAHDRVPEHLMKSSVWRRVTSVTLARRDWHDEHVGQSASSMTVVTRFLLRFLLPPAAAAASLPGAACELISFYLS